MAMKSRLTVLLPLAALITIAAGASAAAPAYRVLGAGVTPQESVQRCAGLSVALLGTSKPGSAAYADQIHAFAQLTRAAVSMTGMEDKTTATAEAQDAMNAEASIYRQLIKDGERELIAGDTRACLMLANVLAETPDLFTRPE